MTDGAQAHYSDVAVRSILAKSAHHKGKGSASAKLGNKPMTWKDILAANGPEHTYPITDNLMSLEDFERLPPDLKIEFCNKMCDKYDIDLKILSRVLFNKGDDGLRQRLRNLGIYGQFNYKKERGKTGIDQFKNDVIEFNKQKKFLKMLNDAAKQAKKNELPSLITIEQFDAMSPTDQVNYINSLVDAYRVPIGFISVELFERGVSYLANHFNRINANSDIHKIPMKDIHNKALMDSKKAEFHNYVSAWREFSPISEAAEEVQEVKATVEPVKVIEEDKSMTKSDVVEVIKPEETVVELVNEEPVVEANPYEYHEMHITSNYIGDGINMDELNAIAMIFKGKRVKVSFEVTEV